MSNKITYYLGCFLYALKEKNKISKSTLFRYVYLFDVTNIYLGNDISISDNFILDRELAVINSSEMNTSLRLLNQENYITIDGSDVIINKSIEEPIKRALSTEKGQQDLNKILYFVDIISSYEEEIVLSFFFGDPNVENAISRNKEDISLKDNKLQRLFEDFENAANMKRDVNLDKYDVFTSWLDFIFENYLKRKTEL